MNFELDEEVRERDAMRLLVFKNKDLFVFLFKKYSAMGNLNKRRGSLDVVSERVITLGEITRFLQDLKLEISQKELMGLVKTINDFFQVRH